MIPQILAVENASFTCPWSEELFRETLREKSISFLVCLTESGELAGFACFLTAADEGELLNIASAPAYRRKGVGQLLLDRCFSECAAKGVSALYLEVRHGNVPARSLYLKNGFEEIGVRRNYYVKPREDAVLMRRIFPDTER